MLFKVERVGMNVIFITIMTSAVLIELNIAKEANRERIYLRLIKLLFIYLNHRPFR